MKKERVLPFVLYDENSVNVIIEEMKKERMFEIDVIQKCIIKWNE